MSATPAIDGWFTTGPDPTLLGSRCTTCETVFFPPTSGFCRNPDCDGEEFTEVPLARHGRIWSYTDAQARVGITANQGLFGHGSSLLLST